MSWINYWKELYNRKYKQRKYPKDIQLELNKKYKSLHRHEKSIKNILKNSCNYKLFGIFSISWIIYPKDNKRIKNHRYMINKIKREIDNIRKYYES